MDFKKGILLIMSVFLALSTISWAQDDEDTSQDELSAEEQQAAKAAGDIEKNFSADMTKSQEELLDELTQDAKSTDWVNQSWRDRRRHHRRMTAGMTDAEEEAYEEWVEKVEEEYEEQKEEWDRMIEEKKTAWKNDEIEYREYRDFRNHIKWLENSYPMNFFDALGPWIIVAGMRIAGETETLSFDDVIEMMSEMNDKLRLKVRCGVAYEDTFREFYYRAAKLNAAMQLNLYAKEKVISAMKAAVQDEAAKLEIDRAMGDISDEEMEALSDEQKAEIMRKHMETTMKLDKNFAENMDRYYAYIAISDSAIASMAVSIPVLIVKGVKLVKGVKDDIELVKDGNIIQKIFGGAKLVAKTRSLKGTRTTLKNLRQFRKTFKKVRANNEILEMVMEEAKKNKEAMEAEEGETAMLGTDTAVASAR